MLIVLLLAISCIRATDALSADAQTGADTEQELIKTITSSDGTRVELAFRAPAKGVPKHVLDMFCANVKLRLYWGVYRETVKSTSRTGQDVRRMARLARHYYPDIRAVDNPFDAPRLSKVDDWLGVKDKDKHDDDHDDHDDYDDDHDDEDNHHRGSDSSPETDSNGQHRGKSRIGQIKMKIRRKLTTRYENDDDDDNLFADQEEADKEIKQKMDASIEVDGAKSTLVKKTTTLNSTRLEKIRHYVKKYAPKVGMGIYTRWSTMWWLMMSCLYTKYYLWDPALEEFIKLKKSMIMYPDFLMLKLQDIDCLPTRFFQRIISACKTLNPLLNYSFGQLSLDNMMRFKGRPN